MSESYVPRSMEATSAEPAARVQRDRVAKPSGWWGMIVFVASEATLFGTFFGTYYYLRFHQVAWPPPGTPKPRVVVPLILVGVLATTSLPMQLAWLSAKAARLRTTWTLLLWVFFVQCGYLAFEIHDLIDQLKRSRPQDNAYASIYYLILGADHAHVALAIVFVAWLLVRLARGFTNYRLVGLRSIVFYVHFVNLLTLLVIGCLLSADV